RRPMARSPPSTASWRAARPRRRPRRSEGTDRAAGGPVRWGWSRRSGSRPSERGSPPTEDEMATQGETHGVPHTARERRLRGALLLIMGCLAILSPFFAGTLALFLVGLLLIACGALEMLETFQAADEARLRSAYLSGALSILAGILLLAQPQLVLRG